MSIRTATPAVLAAAILSIAACATAPASPAPDAPAGQGDAGAPAAVTELPWLRLAPSQLPGGLALEQRLTFVHGGRRDTVDALVEADADEVRVVVHAQGQVAMRLVWNGTSMAETRDPRLPAGVQARRVLNELQFAYWPTTAIAAALPAGWTLQGDAAHRVLVHGDPARPVLEVEHRDGGEVRITYPGEALELWIESREVRP